MHDTGTRFQGLAELDKKHKELNGESDDYSWYFSSLANSDQSSSSDFQTQTQTQNHQSGRTRLPDSNTNSDSSSDSSVGSNSAPKSSSQSSSSSSSGAYMGGWNDLFDSDSSSSWLSSSESYNFGLDSDLWEYFLSKWGDIEDENDWTAFYDRANFDFSDLQDVVRPNRTEIKELGHQAEDFILQCSFDSEECFYEYVPRTTFLCSGVLSALLARAPPPPPC